MVDEMISYNQGQTRYKVRVKSFKHKMNTWANGRIIYLKTLKVDGVTLRMQLYPNGIKVDSQNYVSIFIENLSPFQISFVCDLSLGNGKEKLKDDKMDIESKGILGWPFFYKHNCNAHNKDEDLEISFTVKWLFKEFQCGEEADDRLMQTIKTVKEKTFEIDKKLAGQGQAQAKMEQRMESLERSMSSLLRREATAQKVQQPPYPECPICLENITHETKIMQCGLGHLLCQKCFDRLDYSSCPSCGKAITGRCHGMETYLKTLFDNNN